MHDETLPMITTKKRFLLHVRTKVCSMNYSSKWTITTSRCMGWRKKNYSELVEKLVAINEKADRIN